MSQPQQDLPSVLARLSDIEASIAVADRAKVRFELLDALRQIRELISSVGRRPGFGEGGLLARAEIVLTHKGDMRLAIGYLRQVIETEAAAENDMLYGVPVSHRPQGLPLSAAE